MAIAKVLKNKAYFKRFQPKFRRRRECKTDYKQRRGLVKQRLDKYGTKKYIMVVRISNKKVICQMTYSTIRGDFVFAEASSKELHRYGITFGLKNYAACYCTGLLLARKVLTKCNLHETYIGIDGEPDGDFFLPEADEEKAPFCAILDVGLRRTKIGSRVFGALKCAVDGGIHIPHNFKKFPGFVKAADKSEKDDFDPDMHRDRILGKHVGEYMTLMEDEDEVKYQAYFSEYIKAGVIGEDIADKYIEAHRLIREDPFGPEKEKKNYTKTRRGIYVVDSEGKETVKKSKLPLFIKKKKVLHQIQEAQKRALEALEESD